MQVCKAGKAKNAETDAAEIDESVERFPVPFLTAALLRHSAGSILVFEKGILINKN